MAELKSNTTVVLADRLHQDIVARRLKQGDTYLTASEAASFLNVSKTRANRALQLLAARRTLQRGRGAAPVVADYKAPAEQHVELDSVHVLLPRVEITAEGLYSDGCLIGMQRALPKANIQLNYFPQDDEGRFTEKLISRSLASGETAGFVLVRSSFDAQLAMEESGLPAVIHGSSYPGIKRIPWVERDYHQSAALHAQYMKEAGCDRVMLIMRDITHAGDQTFHDALRAVLHQLGYDNNAIAVRFCPVRVPTISHYIHSDHQLCTKRLGVIAVGGLVAEHAVNAVAALGLTLHEDVKVSYRGYYASGPPAQLKIAHDQDQITPEEQGNRIAHMLMSLAANPQDKVENLQMAQTFVVP